jgi:hypothetical protein
MLNCDLDSSVKLYALALMRSFEATNVSHNNRPPIKPNSCEKKSESPLNLGHLMKHILGYKSQFLKKIK